MMNRQMWRYLLAAIALAVAGCLMIFCAGRVADAHFAAFLSLYLAVGSAFFVFLAMLYRGIGLKGRWSVFLSAAMSSIWLILVWPIVALAALLFWGSDLFHLFSKQKDARRREEEAKRATRFTHMSMDELLSEQRKVMGAMDRSEGEGTRL